MLNIIEVISIGLDQYINGWNSKGEHVVDLQYRKVNWLRNWVISNSELNHESNCQKVALSREKLEELKESCDYVLKHESEAEEVLPILPGFFFGIYDYSEWYFDTIKVVKKDVEEILSIKDVKEVEYEDWW